MFTATSAGFNCGNFSEFKLDNKICLPRDNYKRGITVLYLVNDLKNYHAWNFDFYNSYTKIATNRNFISLLRKLPGNTYFAMSIKDDAYKNLFEGTKNFLSRIIGFKSFIFNRLCNFFTISRALKFSSEPMLYISILFLLFSLCVILK